VSSSGKLVDEVNEEEEPGMAGEELGDRLREESAASERK
jgi:hypothetical protein